MSVDYARRNLESRQKDLTRLGDKRSQAQKSVSDASKKEVAARTALSKAKTESSLKSKARDLERATKATTDAQSKLTAVEKDYAKKARDVAKAQATLAQEEAAQRKKDEQSTRRATKENQQRLADHSWQISTQGNAIAELKERVTNLESLPDTVTILMLASGPEDCGKLRQDKEAREIREAILKSRHREAVRLEDRWAVRTEDLFQAINETEPTIIHFSGHGAESGELVMEDDFGFTKLVTPEAMARVLSTVSDKVKLLVYNACFSEEQAQMATESIDAAIGMSDTISDAAAVAFAARFYSAIGFGLSLKKAYDQACASLMFDSPGEIDTPSLYVADGIDPNEVFYVAAGITE